jgi:hypothetical protein
MAELERSTNDVGRGGPARGYSWNPFEPGNVVALKHGGYASSLRLAEEDPRVAELVAWILETQPVSHPADAGAVCRLALVYRRLELSKAALDEADETVTQRPLAAYVESASWLGRLRDDHARWLREAGRIEAELARTPSSRGKLGLHLATAQRALSLVELHAAAALEGEAVEVDG